MAMKGQIVDASIVSIPKQRNSREENARIKRGRHPRGVVREQAAKKRCGCALGQENGTSFYGYKIHVSVIYALVNNTVVNHRTTFLVSSF